MDNEFKNINTIKQKKNNIIQNLILISFFLLVLFFYLFSSPRREKDVIIHISENDSISSISTILEDKNVIRHAFLLNTILSLVRSDKNISTGDYLFKKNISFLNVFINLSKGRYGVNPIKITFKEGIDNEGIVKLLAHNIPNFRKDLFLSDKRVSEGYLFPDTYFFFPLSTTDEIIDKFTKNFNKKINKLDPTLLENKEKLNQIIIMASIIEKEASGYDDALIISGILWKRLKLGMLLQVDVSPITYKKIGLPDMPIANPGYSSIYAAINPTISPYLFYLHDNDRVVHYSTNFSEHRSNIARYLK